GRDVLPSALESLPLVETNSSADQAGALARARTMAAVRMLRGIGDDLDALECCRCVESPLIPRPSRRSRPAECRTSGLNRRRTPPQRRPAAGWVAGARPERDARHVRARTPVEAVRRSPRVGSDGHGPSDAQPLPGRSRPQGTGGTITTGAAAAFQPR